MGKDVFDITKNEAEVANFTPNAFVKKMDKLYTSLAAQYGKMNSGYLQFAALVGKCRETKQAQECGYTNVYDLCADRYGMSRGTVGNLCKIYMEFYNHETGELLPEYANKKLTELLALLPNRKNVEEKESGVDQQEESGADQQEESGADQQEESGANDQQDGAVPATAKEMAKMLMRYCEKTFAGTAEVSDVSFSKRSKHFIFDIEYDGKTIVVGIS